MRILITKAQESTSAVVIKEWLDQDERQELKGEGNRLLKRFKEGVIKAQEIKVSDSMRFLKTKRKTRLLFTGFKNDVYQGELEISMLGRDLRGKRIQSYLSTLDAIGYWLDYRLPVGFEKAALTMVNRRVARGDVIAVTYLTPKTDAFLKKIANARIVYFDYQTGKIVKEEKKGANNVAMLVLSSKYDPRDLVV